MDTGQFDGCTAPGDWAIHEGLIPYHAYNMIKAGWLDVVTIDNDSTDVILGDVRIYGEVVRVDSPASDDYWLFVNHKNTLYDDILGGRGLLIWHIKSAPLMDRCNGSDELIVDLEAHSGRWDPEVGVPYCPASPLVPDMAAGVDSLDCRSDMLESAFWAGVGTGFGSHDDFTSTSNPGTQIYEAGADSRMDTQTDTSGVNIFDIESIVNFVNNYKVKFDVVIN